MANAESEALPDADRTDFLEAFDQFDREHRGTQRWQDWKARQDRTYAVKHQGRLYPVKEITSMATERPSDSFPTNQVNSFLEEHGFDVVTLRPSSIRAALEEVFESYLDVRQSEPYGKTDEDGNKRRIWALFEEIESLFEESAALSQRPHLQVTWSLGQGRWTHVPQIAILDDRITATLLEGFYPVYLFRADMTGVYLKYGCGLGRPKERYGRSVGHALVANRAEWLRRRSTPLEERGFTSKEVPDLRRPGGIDRGSKLSNIAQKFYSAEALPNDEQLLADLDALLQAYDQHVNERLPRNTVHIDTARLKTAVENIIRPALIERGDLEEGGSESYHHHKIIPEVTPRLTPDALAEDPKGAVIGALKADVNLLSGNWDRSPAIKLVERADPADVREEVSNLLYGADSLSERVWDFLDWGEAREIEDGKTAELNGTVASYLLALSDPQEYAFCKTRYAYRPAVEALLGEDEYRRDWPERIAHARDFYKEALRLFREEYGLPFHDLMHVHIAFYLAEREDPDALWGEGVVEMDSKKEERDQSSAYVISPGEQAEYWEDCKEGGYVCVGYDEVGNLKQYDDYESFRAAFYNSFYPNRHRTEQKISEKSAEVWKLTQLKPGDSVVANRGANEVLAVGEVVDPGYEWRPDRESYRHVVRVNWDDSYAQEISPQEHWRSATVREVSEDLLERIRERAGSASDGQAPRSSYEPPPFEKIYESIRGQGMRIDRQTLRRYHVSLRTRKFVILSGISGTGKTWLTKLYANAVNARRHLQPVAPNWTTNEDLLGYYNPMAEQYQDTPVSRFLQEAEAAYKKAERRGVKPQPYHLVLDEMNLARVEYYFARFLSKMEERQRGETAKLELGSQTEVQLPPNLYFIGTVNIDETTHEFADKVYDRAQLIEMPAPRDLLADHLGEKPYAAVLLDVWDALKKVAPFAFRVIDEITEYIDTAEEHGSSWEAALDEQLLQKVLPKVKGTEHEVGEALQSFLEIIDEETYPLSHEKARRMHEDYRSHGFTSYFR